MRAAEQQNGLIVGRYALHDEIAAGGMATVHFGRLIGLAGFHRIVAIKRLHPVLAKQPEFVSMFLDELRLAARIQHPNVVATLDAVEQSGELFLVMEYIHGESLARLIRLARRRGVSIPPSIAVTIMCGALHGLHAAHEAKTENHQPLEIVHRDVSPQNVIVGFDGVARVLDFGIAKAVGRLQTTRDGQIKGKMAYLAPEHIRGGPIDRRTDVYGAAVVLWEALTGAQLFEGDNDAIILGKVLASEVPPPSSLTDSLAPALDAIVIRALSRDPEARFPTARAMALALQKDVGVVSACEVGDWFRDLAHEHMSGRSQYLAELEQLSLLEKSRAAASLQQPAEVTGSVIPLSGSASVRDATTPMLARVRWSVPALLLTLSAGIAAAVVMGTRNQGEGWGDVDIAAASTAPTTSAAEAPMKDAEPLTRTGQRTATEPLGSADAAAATSSDEHASATVQTASSSDKPTPAAAVSAVARPAPEDTLSRGSAGASRLMRALPSEPRSTSVVNSRVSSLPAAPSSAGGAQSPSTVKGCRPPYTIDAAGIKRFRVECL